MQAVTLFGDLLYFLKIWHFEDLLLLHSHKAIMLVSSDKKVKKNVKAPGPLVNFWQITPKIVTLYSILIALFIIKFGSDRIKSVGGVAFLNRQPHIVLC